MMRKSLLVVSLCGAIAMSLWTVGALAASETESIPAGEVAAVLADGDAAAGKAASAVCAGCHGANGVSAIPANPNLAGQGAPYIYKQLVEFKSGVRENAIMLGMVAGLDDTAMKNLAAYYASLPAAEGVSNSENLALGKSIYQGGISSVGIAACTGCHGPNGAGNDAAKFPRLAGQHAEYITTTLKHFRAGTRANDPNNMMRQIAHRLSDAEIAALANYIQGLY